jgi:hypothetical protein
VTLGRRGERSSACETELRNVRVLLAAGGAHGHEPSLGAREESHQRPRPVNVNSQLSYYSAAAAHADAIRDAYRNPPLPRSEETPGPGRRSRLAQALGRVAQPGHRRENLLAVR